MNISQAKEIKLKDYLEKINCPIILEKDNGNDLWYCSPAREEKEPSFHIDVNNNWWYDQGEGVGGSDVISLAKFVINKDVRGVLKHLKDLFGGILFKNDKKALKRINIKRPKNIFIEAKELFFDWHFEYLSNRKIDQTIGCHYLKNVKYKNITYNGNCSSEKVLWAIGFKNQIDGWELRQYLPNPNQNSPYRKSSIESKYMTFIPGINNRIVDIFEGFSDFLPYLSHYGNGSVTPINSTIVLNSLAFHKKAKEKLVSRLLQKECPIKLIRTFFDNHEPGYKAHDQMKSLDCEVITMNHIYSKFDDLGEMIKKNY